MINRYQNILKEKIDGKTVYKTSRYPEGSLWWVISIANTGNAGANTLTGLSQNSLVIPEGVQIRIPDNPIQVYNVFNQINL